MRTYILAALFCSIAFVGGCKTVGEFLARPTADPSDGDQTVGDQAIDEGVDFITLAFGAAAGAAAGFGGKIAKDRMRAAREA